MTRNRHRRKLAALLMAICSAVVLTVTPLKVIARDIVVFILILTHHTHGYIGYRLEFAASDLSVIQRHGKRIPTTQAEYDRWEATRLPVAGIRPGDTPRRVYKWEPESNYFSISVDVGHNLPCLSVDCTNHVAMFTFTNRYQKETALSNFICMLRHKPVTSLTRDSDIEHDVMLLSGFGYSTNSLQFLKERSEDWYEVWTVRGLAKEMYTKMIREVGEGLKPVPKPVSGME